MKYQKVNAQFLIPESADIKTVIGSLWELYEVDRISEAVEDEPVLFIVEEIKQDHEEEPENAIDAGFNNPVKQIDNLIGVTFKKETLLEKIS